MKITYFVYKQVNGVQQLAVATQEEWDAILKENRKLPLAHHRRFINDRIKDGNELDCIWQGQSVPVQTSCAINISSATELFRDGKICAVSVCRLRLGE